MRKDQLNQLVSKYKRARGNKDRYFSEIYKAVQPMITYVKKRFNKNFLVLVDYDSVASEALLKSISKYKEGSGHFANYFMTWLRSMVTRDGINNPVGIKLPEYLAKKDFQITDEAKTLMLSGRAKEELMDIYGLTSSQYDNLLHFYTEVPRYLEGDFSSYLYSDTDIKLDIKTMLGTMPDDFKKATIMYFGLEGSKVHSEESITRDTGLNAEQILEYLKDNYDIQQIMREYN